MAAKAPIRLQYNPVKTWPGTAQGSWAGPAVDILSVAPNTVALFGFQGNGNEFTNSAYNLTAVGNIKYRTSPATPVPVFPKFAGPFNQDNYFLAPAALNAAMHTVSLTLAYTLQFRVYLNSLATAATVWRIANSSNLADTFIRIETDGSVTVSSDGGLFVATTVPGVITAKNWHSIGLYLNPTTMKILVDSAEQASGALFGNAGKFTGFDVQTIGAWDNLGTAATLDGYVAQFRFSNASSLALPTSDVTPRTSSIPVSNIVYVSKFGSDATGTGTWANPFLTIAYALANMPGLGATSLIIKDSGTYAEQLFWNTSGAGLYAADGQQPVIKLSRGATPGTYGARITGRSQFYSGGGSTIHVAKTGNDANPGTSGSPKLTIAGAIAATATGDCIQVDDSGTYTEDINFGAKAITLQAKNGQLPTLTKVTSAGNHIVANAGKATSLYGFNVVEPVGSTGTIVTLDANFEAYDCNFINGSAGINITGTSRTAVVKNCFFNRQINGRSFESLGINTIDNCYISQNIWSAASGTNAFTIFFSAGHTASSFSNSTIDACVCTAGIQITVSGGTVNDSVSNCIFSNISTPDLSLAGNGCSLSVTADTAGSLQVFNSSAATSSGVGFLSNRNSVGGVYKVYISIYSSCHSRACREGFNTSGESTVQDCVAIACVVGFTLGGGNPSTNECLRCAAVNSSTFGFNVHFGSIGGLDMKGCIEKSSATAGITADSAFSPTYSCFGSGLAGSATAGTGTIVADPKLISTLAGEENMGLLPDSPCILTGDSTPTINMGIAGKLFEVAAANCVVNGITFEGDVNFHNGVVPATSIGSAATIRYCAFRGLGPVACQALGAGTVEKSVFEANGMGIQVIDTGCFVERNVGLNCQSSFIQNNAPMSTILNNSSYGCLYGQYDGLSGLTLSQGNNVYSASGAYDYSGDGTQAYSCVGTLDPARLNDVDGNSTRNNPIFRNPLGGDLRLQAIAASEPTADPPINYYFDSPAVAGGSDGGDMGAFSFAYGALSEAWTTIDFATTGYRNPDGLVRTIDPIKLAEFTREDTKTESTAVGYPFKYRFNWGPSNDMPAAQVADLVALFSADSPRIRIDLTGTGSSYVEFAVLKSQSFEFEELAGIGYSSDAVPTPIKNMEFRQS